MSTPPVSASPVGATDVRTASPDPAHRDRPAGSILINAPCVFCGYNLRGLTAAGNCPECGTAVNRSVNQSPMAQRSRVQKRWAVTVLGGLLAMLLLCPSQIWVALEMRFGDAAFGSATRLNVPGPKVWATTLLQRPLGYRPEWLGVQGTWLTLLGLAATFCLTSPRVDLDRQAERFRLAARWLPALLTGGFYGFLMNAEYLDASDVAVGKYALLGIAGVELPCTLAVMLYLARVGLQLGRPALAKSFQRVAMAIATCMIAGITMGLLAKGLADERTGFMVQTWSALYGAACVVTALLTIGAMLQLAIELLLVATPARWKGPNAG